MAAAAHLQRGAQAERLAEQLVRRARCRIVARNVRYPCGEIDLIARDRDTLVFVDVRARNSSRYGRPEETVDAGKQRRICADAQLWLQQHDPGGRMNCRFDVIGILGTGADAETHWIKDAFSPG